MVRREIVSESQNNGDEFGKWISKTHSLEVVSKCLHQFRVTMNGATLSSIHGRQI